MQYYDANTLIKKGKTKSPQCGLIIDLTYPKQTKNVYI